MKAVRVAACCGPSSHSNSAWRGGAARLYEFLQFAHVGLFRFGQAGAEFAQVFQRHIQIAHGAESPAQTSQVGEGRFDGGTPEIVAEQLLSGARPADGDAHLVDVLRVVADAGAVFLQNDLHDLSPPDQTAGFGHVHGGLDVRIGDVCAGRHLRDRFQGGFQFGGGATPQAGALAEPVCEPL